MADDPTPYLYVNDETKEAYNVNLLRGWQRSQLKLLKEFVTNDLVSQTRLSGASGLRAGSHVLGGKMTALARAGLIVKAGKDDDNNWLWQLNEKRIDRKTVQNLLDEIKI